MIKVNVNDKEYSINFDNKPGNQGTINDQPFELDLIKRNESQYHLIKNNKSYSIDILAFEYEKKEVKLKINGCIYEATVQNELDILLKELGIENKSKPILNKLNAPMPGMVLEIFVNQGQKVIKGQSLVVLEAMKMENNLKANTDGIIKEIHCKKNETVNKNQLLITFE